MTDERSQLLEARRALEAMIDPLRPPGMPGSYVRGHYQGIVDSIATLRILEQQAARASNVARPLAPAHKLWLWKNGDHFLAFDHEYPCFTPGGDPMTLGEPVGYAIYKQSNDRAAPTQPAPMKQTPPDIVKIIADGIETLYEGAK